MKEEFVKHKFMPASLDKLDRVIGILNEYEAQGYDLTLRQLYYQMVRRNYIPNHDREYNSMGDLVSNARKAGLIDWEMIKDRGRKVEYPGHWESPAEILNSAVSSFRLDRWKDQDYHVEVLVEKDALSGILLPVCRDNDVRLTACKGYSSDSHLYETGKRIERAIEDGKEVAILHLADHDPSGIDMTRDIAEKLSMFSWNHIGVDRLALNMNQVEEINPPENPAKTTDSRYAGYVVKFGDKSYELDAIEPADLVSIVLNAIDRYRDNGLWDEVMEREDGERERLLEVARNWND